ncbi:hypothetical protein [Lysinibacillus sphaericus]|uniref:hypothetical protein n=1 Tax=Lysinibacillus sphaericus TaxID=1421 RepID=UPI0015D49FD7|nr:hypothetical protein [Lysinibacillus sphaericus]
MMQKKFKLKDDLSISIHIQPPHSIVDDVFHSREAPYYFFCVFHRCHGNLFTKKW